MLVEPLTNRESEILRLLANGLTNQEIAEQLVLSTGTVKAHTNHIFSKLSVTNRTQALRRAQEWGLLDDTSTAIRSVAQHHHNLPGNVTAFIGREKELSTLDDLLHDPRVRLITIQGAGGMGKTALALETARRQLDFFSDGVFFVPLAKVTDARNIASAIVDAMGIPFQPTGDVGMALRDQLQHKKMLLVLDNFEHLLGGLDSLIQLLEGTTELKMLITSRERLNVSAEVLFVLSGMQYQRELSARNLSKSDAAQLLLHWARAANPTLEFGDEDLPYIAQICHLTQGMPLAIVLAAGWLEMLSIAEIAEEIGGSINILESQMRDLPERQRSMRATIAYSWKRLTPEEQRSFIRLSVFRGGFTREAAGQVAGAELRHLQMLVNRSFISARGGRYEIHELLRQFGEEQLAQSGYAADIYDAHSAYYLDFLRQRDDDLKGRRQREALDEIHTDYENVEVAWLWAVDKRNYEAIQGAVDCLTNFGVMRAFMARVEALLRHTLELWDSIEGETGFITRDMVGVRHIHLRHCLSLMSEREPLEAIIQRARMRKDDRETAYGLWVMANQVSREGDFATNLMVLEESLRLWRGIGDSFYISHVLTGMLGEDMSPEPSKWAIGNLQESIEIRRRNGDRYELSFSLLMLGIWLLYSCEFEQAEAYFDEALTLQDETYRTPDFSGVVGHKGSLVFWRGEVEIAAFYAMLGLEFSRDMNYFGDRSTCQALMSFVASLRGDYAEARALCEAASQAELYNLVSVGVHWGMALACCGLGDDDETRRALGTCLDIAVNYLKSLLFQRLCLPIAAVLAARAGEPVRAAELMGLATAQSPQMTGWLPRWSLFNEIRADLEQQLGADFEVACVRGAALDVATVAVSLLDDLKRQ
jgi:predicted ATPase/DNA-binding CsgD family transcriptional regulator